jgi:hypothetical protein
MRKERQEQQYECRSHAKEETKRKEKRAREVAAIKGAQRAQIEDSTKHLFLAKFFIVLLLQ